jgi:isopentenyl diphosphate isomerase/L-lactate dehydrogenase-like FMN-dependent dehydrogenase
MRQALNLFDFESLAREKMEAGAFDFVAGGSWDEITLAENVEAWRRFRLLPRVLVDVSSIDTSTTLLGLPVAMPIGIAPTALHRLAHSDGEVATARAAAAANVLFCQSTLSSIALEDVASASDGPRWFQLYVYKDRGFTRDLVQRAVAAGCKALVLTVDLPVTGHRERDLRRGFAIPPDMYANQRNLAPEGDLIGAIAFLHDQSLTWRDIEWLRGLSDLPLVTKGIHGPEDAVLAVEHGAEAVWVSNHGGRQLDRVPATADLLPGVVEAVSGRAEVYVDGGVRRGIDVLIALGLGARAVFLGRPVLYALAADGEAGVARALELIGAELRTGMQLLGTRSLPDVSHAFVTAT